MFTLVVPIQTRLPELLDASREDTAWVVTVTLLVSAIVTPIAGRLGDMYGKRRVVIALLAALIVGSVIAALSQDIVGIIAGRALQGAAVGVVPLGISILRDLVSQDRVDSGIALISATLGVGGALGMPVSAFVTDVADWHLVFWVAAALGAIVLVLVVLIVPTTTLMTGGRFDYLGAMGLSAGLIGILLTISRGDVWGWASPATIACGAGGLVVLLLWGWYELRAPHPLLDLRVAARRPVLLTNLASVAMGFSLFASNIAYPQMLELPPGSGAGLGLSLVGASLVIAPSGVVMMLLSPLAGRIARTTGPRVLMLAGALALVAAYVFTLVWSSEVWHILIANLLVGVGIGFGFASMPMLIMRAVPPSETGASNGLNALFRSVGPSTAAAVIGAVLASHAIDFEGAPVPTADGFQLAFTIGLLAAITAFAIALFIPSRPDPATRSAL